MFYIFQAPFMAVNLWSGLTSTFSAIMAVVSVIFVVWLAYKYSLWLSKRGMHAVKGKYINIVDRVVVGQEKSIILVKAGEKHLLIGVTNNSINVLKELEDTELTANTPPTAPTIKDFKSIFNEVLAKNLPFIKNKDKENHL